MTETQAGNALKRLREVAEVLPLPRKESLLLLDIAEELNRWTLRCGNQDPANDEPLYGLDGHDFWQAKRRLASLDAADSGEAT